MPPSYGSDTDDRSALQIDEQDALSIASARRQAGGQCHQVVARAGSTDDSWEQARPRRRVRIPGRRKTQAWPRRHGRGCRRRPQRNPRTSRPKAFALQSLSSRR